VPDPRAPSFDVKRAESLALDAARGREAAFNELVELIWPELSRSMSSSRRLAAGGASEDGPHDVGLRIIEKLKTDDFRALRLYEDWRTRHPDKTFLDWLRIVAANVTRDYLRALRGHSSPDDVPSPKQLLNAFSVASAVDDCGTRPPMTWAQTARELIEYAGARLPAEQFDALSAWLRGENFDEIANAQGVTDGAAGARRIVRAAIAVLRREFGRG
jgi:DNA-directed RNA polymerase specialized sigma24 family protein